MGDEGVTETEHSNPEGKTATTVRRRRKKIYQAILQQMEFYFSDANLTKDRFLSRLVEEHPYIDLRVFLKFNKIRALTDNVEDIANAVSKSEVLTLSTDRTKVYRELPIRPNYNEDECSIYVENLPADAKHEWLKEIFSVYGKVAYVSIPKYRQNGKIKGFAFVEFESPEFAKRAIEVYGAAGCCLPTDMAPEQLCSVATFEPGEGKNQVGFVEQAQKEEGDNAEGESGDAKADGAEEAIEEEDPDAENSATLPKEKKKRKRKKDQSDEEEAKVEDDEEVQQTEDSLPPVSKRKKKSKREKGSDEQDSTQGGDEKEEKDANISSSEECTSLLKDKGRKKRKMEEDDEEKQLEEEDKKFKLEKEEPSNIKEEEQKERKKKTRKKRNKDKKEKQSEEAVGLRILSKKEWKRLRNKYLTLQRKNMKNLRRQIMGGRCGNYWENDEGNGKEVQDEEWGEGVEKDIEHIEDPGNKDNKVKEEKTKARVQFTPGVIIKIQLKEPLESAKKFKAEVKNLPKSNAIAYIDARDAQSIVYFRCETAEAAVDLLNDLPWEDRWLLEGEEEKDYWDKILQDRDEKITKKIRVKQRGRDRFLKMAENLIGKHARYEN